MLVAEESVPTLFRWLVHGTAKLLSCSASGISSTRHHVWLKPGCTCRGEPVGECGGCQVMSNPLILHGAKLALPRPRPLPPRPLFTLPEEPFETPSTQSPGPHAPQSSATAAASLPQPGRQAAAASSRPPPIATARRQASLNGVSSTASSQSKELSTDQLRLRLRMQSTIQAYTGNAPGVVKKPTPSHLVTATVHNGMYRRTNSYPVRSASQAGKPESRRYTTWPSEHSGQVHLLLLLP